MPVNPALDLTITRLIKAPRTTVWNAWANREIFARWWVPAPAKCKVVAMDLHPGGAFETEISEEGGPFGPHIQGCFLDIVAGQRIVFTNALVGGWRPARHPFITAIITLADAPAGTQYSALVRHKDEADKKRHAELGFLDGWGTVIDQLAALIEK